VSFESGSVSFRMLYVPRALPPDAVSALRQARRPADQHAGRRHDPRLGDRDATCWTATSPRTTAMHGGYLRLTLMQAMRKIPEALLRAECRMEELAHLQAQGLERISQSARRDIRRIHHQAPAAHHAAHPEGHRPALRPAQPPGLHQRAVRQAARRLPDHGFSLALGFGGVPVLPETAALQRKKTSIKDWVRVQLLARGGGRRGHRRCPASIS
jgi:hypothetical protein